MSKADELKSKNENLFERNTILLNENERLKKENAELENKIADIKANCDLAIEGKDVKIKELEETIANLKEQVQSQVEATIELDKENAELKGIKDVATLIRANNDTVTTLMQLNNMLVSKSQQLTKAKEIIRTFLNMPMPNNEEVFADVGIFLTKAEQFLKEIEK